VRLGSITIHLPPRGAVIACEASICQRSLGFADHRIKSRLLWPVNSYKHKLPCIPEIQLTPRVQTKPILQSTPEPNSSTWKGVREVPQQPNARKKGKKKRTPIIRLYVQPIAPDHPDTIPWAAHPLCTARISNKTYTEVCKHS